MPTGATRRLRSGSKPRTRSRGGGPRGDQGFARARPVVATIVLAGAALAVAVVLAAFRVGEEPGALSDWQALGLGLVQGATELLPISSSAHLILVPWLADWEYLKENDDFNQTFDVALHLGTLAAVVAYFWTDLVGLVLAWWRSSRRRAVETPEERIAWFVVVATLPAAIVGAVGSEAIPDHLGEPWQIAILLAVFGVLLWVADRLPARRETADLGVREAVVVGLAQSLSLAPGVSRSGITITAGRFLGLGRADAARMAFLLLVPITFGAVVWQGLTDVVLGDVPPGSAGPFVVGVLAAAASGALAIVCLLSYLRRHDYSVFAVYRLLVAVFVVALIATGVRDATF
jgi:undecaprenyl-diphosphatase